MSFGVDTDAMARSAAAVGVAAERIDVLLASMRRDVDDMLAGWSGNGADAHRNLHERYQSDVNAINSNLREMQAALERTQSLYVNQESEQNGDHVTMRNQILA